MIRGRTLVLALVAVLLARWAEVGAQSEDHRSARIIARTAPLFRAVLPPDVFLQLQAEPFDTRYGEVWDVTCRDAEGRLLAELNWGTRRRCLLDISTFVIDGRRTDEAAARLAADVVANRSLDWVSALDRSAHRDRWQSPRAPLPNRAIWSTRWSAMSRQALVQIDSRSGALRCAAFWWSHKPPLHFAAHKRPR